MINSDYYVKFEYNNKPLPDELIYDINKLLEYFYKNDYKKFFIPIDEDPKEYIQKINEDIENDTNLFDFGEYSGGLPPILIEQLNRNGIKFHLMYEDDNILEINFKNDVIYLNCDENDSIYLSMLIIILCNHYKVINNNITIKSYSSYYEENFIDEYFFSVCAKILFDYVDYSLFECVIDNGFYYFNLKKDKTIILPKIHTIDEYFVKI